MIHQAVYLYMRTRPPSHTLTHTLALSHLLAGSSKSLKAAHSPATGRSRRERNVRAGGRAVQLRPRKHSQSLSHERTGSEGQGGRWRRRLLLLHPRDTQGATRGQRPARSGGAGGQEAPSSASELAFGFWLADAMGGGRTDTDGGYLGRFRTAARNVRGRGRPPTAPGVGGQAWGGQQKWGGGQNHLFTLLNMLLLLSLLKAYM